MRPTIIIGSRDPGVFSAVAQVLERSGSTTVVRRTARETIAAARRLDVDGVLIDARLPASLTACREIRDSQTSTRLQLVVVVARLGSSQRRTYRNAGADRIFAVSSAAREIAFALAPERQQVQVSHGAISLDPALWRVWHDGVMIELPRIEFMILDLFLRHPGRVFSRREIIVRCWPRNVFVDPRTVNVHIATLRRLLGPGFHGNPIRSVRSLGYGLDASPSEGRAS